MSQIFDIYVGTERQHFTAHEVFLARSPKIKSMCTKQAAKKRNGRYTTSLVFPFEHPNSFGHLLEYLYFNIIAVPASNCISEARQLADLFSVARRYQLPELQEDIIARLDNSEMSSRVSTIEFFSLAEDLFSEGMVNSLQKYFAKVAPPLLQTLDDEHMSELERMVTEGGDFAQALFATYREAFRLKVREGGHKPLKGLEKELSTSSDMAVGTYLKIKMQPEIKDEHGTKESKVSSPSWDSLSEADKTLVRLRTETGNWNQIRQAWSKATGADASIKELLARYGGITSDWWQLKDGDVCNPSPLLFPSEAYPIFPNLTLGILSNTRLLTRIFCYYLEGTSHSGRSASRGQVPQRYVSDDRRRHD